MINEDSFEQLLITADKSAARAPVPHAETIIAAVRRRQSRLKMRNIMLAGCASAAAVILIAGLIWMRHDHAKQLQIAGLQNEIELLNQRLDSAMAMIQETLAAQRRQEKLDQLEKQLAQYNNFDKELATQEENTALTILVQADRLYQANLHQDAQTFYKRIVEQYPNTYWAQIARQKLNDKNESLRKGDML